nr:MAG TPA: hypothetical protein [Caudoviricetes sp.]
MPFYLYTDQSKCHKCLHKALRASRRHYLYFLDELY